MQKNADLNYFIEAKLIDRLKILAEHNFNPNNNSIEELLNRGKHIFGPNEKDSQSSANFQVLLLDCLEKWALTFQFENEEGKTDSKDDDVLSAFSRKHVANEKFYNAYMSLIDKGIKFPSVFMQQKKS